MVYKLYNYKKAEALSQCKRIQASLAQKHDTLFTFAVYKNENYKMSCFI